MESQGAVVVVGVGPVGAIEVVVGPVGEGAVAGGPDGVVVIQKGFDGADVVEEVQGEGLQGKEKQGGAVVEVLFEAVAVEAAEGR